MTMMTTTTTTTDDDEKKRINIINDDDDDGDDKEKTTEKEDHTTTTDTTSTTTTTTNESKSFVFTGCPSRKRYPIKSLECYESIKDDEDFGTMITFHCKLSTGKSLIFNCRDSSKGVLIKEFANETLVVKNEESKGQVDHNFFDKGYTLAGSTGFQIWPGSRLMTEAICWPLITTTTTTNDGNDILSSSSSFDHQYQDCLKLQEIQQLIRNQKANILEIGSGIGVVGIALASMGGNVLQTDLHTLTDNAIWPNQILNKTSTATQKTNTTTETTSQQSSFCCPEFLQPYMNDVVTIDNGYAATTPLDWTKPLEEQIPNKVLSSIDLIIGCDCLWLKHMEDDLLQKIQRIFELSTERRPNNCKFLITYQRRGPNTMFTTIESLITKIQSEPYNWNYDCLAWRSINCSSNYDNDDDDDDGNGNGDSIEDSENDLFLIEIVPSSS